MKRRPEPSKQNRTQTNQPISRNPPHCPTCKVSNAVLVPHVPPCTFPTGGRVGQTPAQLVRHLEPRRHHAYPTHTHSGKCTDNPRGSDKLSLAFRLFDTDGDGFISNIDMWHYLNGFITVLVALSSSFTPSRSKRAELVNRAAMALTQTVFADADVNRDNRISYEEFGRWYNDGGFRVVPWLELLDVRKWPSSESGAGAGSGAAAAASQRRELWVVVHWRTLLLPFPSFPFPALSSASSSFSYSLPRAGAPFACCLPATACAGTSSASASGTVEPITSVTIKQRDVTRLEMLLSQSGLRQYSPSHFVKLFREAAGPGSASLTKADFDRVMRDLIPGDSLSSDSKTFLSFVLSNIFAQFATETPESVR